MKELKKEFEAQLTPLQNAIINYLNELNKDKK